MGNKSTKASGKLSRDEIIFLKKNTNFDEATIQDWYAGFVKDCPSGELKKDKFIQMYGQVFPSGNAEQFSEHVFRTFDMDQSGTIDFKEFLLALHVTSNGTPREKLAWAFKMYDVDGNGKIDIEEMKKVIRGVYSMLGHEENGQAEKIFARMDVNSDGEITLDEFISACMKDSKLMGLITPMNKE